MEITTTQLKRVDVVEVSGRVDSSTAPDLEEALKSIVDAGRYRICMDLENLEYLSSAGIKVLIAILKTCKRWNRGDLRLANMSDRISDVIIEDSTFIGFVHSFVSLYQLNNWTFNDCYFESDTYSNRGFENGVVTILNDASEMTFKDCDFNHTTDGDDVDGLIISAYYYNYVFFDIKLITKFLLHLAICIRCREMLLGL